jgi:fumarylacetoacetase
MTRSAKNDFWRWKSWVESANDPAIGAPLQCLPYCSFAKTTNPEGPVHLGVIIGNLVLDLNELALSGLLDSLGANVVAGCSAAQLNSLMRCGLGAWSDLRRILTGALREDADARLRRSIAPMLIPKESVRFLKPVAVANYTDFYASIHHATNVGRLFRPDQPLLPNYKWIPVGYHGRASSLVISGSEIRRPFGQTGSSSGDTPVFRPTAQLDYELEVAAYVGMGNQLGQPISIAAAESHIFGLSLLNDWSARDIQAWEYQPLGPFLGKSFATSLSPWVVPVDALRPFRMPMMARPSSDPQSLPYLASSDDESGIDLTLQVLLSTVSTRNARLAPFNLSTCNLRDLYWSFAQMVAHHTSNGCNLMEGDLIASGTVSGPDEGSQGCLLEITRRGASPLRLPNGETRTFLENGDEVILRGFCEREGFPRMSFGECRGTVLAAPNES